MGRLAGNGKQGKRSFRALESTATATSLSTVSELSEGCGQCQGPFKRPTGQGPKVRTSKASSYQVSPIASYSTSQPSSDASRQVEKVANFTCGHQQPEAERSDSNLCIERNETYGDCYGCLESGNLHHHHQNSSKELGLDCCGASSALKPLKEDQCDDDGDDENDNCQRRASSNIKPPPLAVINRNSRSCQGINDGMINNVDLSSCLCFTPVDRDHLSLTATKTGTSEYDPLCLDQSAEAIAVSDTNNDTNDDGGSTNKTPLSIDKTGDLMGTRRFSSRWQRYLSLAALIEHSPGEQMQTQQTGANADGQLKPYGTHQLDRNDKTLLAQSNDKLSTLSSSLKPTFNAVNLSQIEEKTSKLTSLTNKQQATGELLNSINDNSNSNNSEKFVAPTGQNKQQESDKKTDIRGSITKGANGKKTPDKRPPVDGNKVGDSIIKISESNNNKNSIEPQLSWMNIAQRYGKMPPLSSRGHLIRRFRKSCLCNLMVSSFTFMFPIFASFKNYSLPGDLLADLVAGFTIAILHIPQGMAYGLLAGVEPINGLYVSLVPVIVMALMSKSPHVSYGTFAVISMLLANCTESIKVALRQQELLAQQPFVSSSATSSVYGISNHTSSLMPEVNRQVSRKQADFFGAASDTGNDALVITNNHKPPAHDPTQQLLKNLLTSRGTIAKDESHQATSITSHQYLQHTQTESAVWPIGDSPTTTAPLTSDLEFIMPSNIEILTCVCLIVGLAQMTMAVMRLGFLSLMFSDQLVSSFTTASAIHVVTSQLGSLFDIQMPRVPDGLFKVFRIWWLFGTKLFEGFNQYTALMSLFSLLFLLNIKEIVEPAIRKRYRSLTCLPSELILMSVLILCSWYWRFNVDYGIFIVGNVPTGLPTAQVPRLDLVPVVMQDALAVAVISFAMNLSLAQVYAKKLRYKLEPNQELFALGASNVVGSFFSCFPCASSLSRSAVQSNLNAKSQLCSLFSCAIVVSIICYFAPVFHDLPRSTLSCIIVVALRGILLQIKDFATNWRLSKLDALVWAVTFMAVLAFDVTYGLIVGILASLSMVFYRLLTPNYSVLGQLPGTEIYVDTSAFIECNEIELVKIFRFNSALCYLNRTMFKSGIEKLLRSSGGVRASLAPLCLQQQKQGHAHQVYSSQGVEYLIIDCSALSYCDFSGAATLVEIVEELEDKQITVFLAACPLKLINMLEKMDRTSVLQQNVYQSITDALNQIRYLRSRSVDIQSLHLNSSSDLWPLPAQTTDAP